MQIWQIPEPKSWLLDDYAFARREGIEQQFGLKGTGNGWRDSYKTGELRQDKVRDFENHLTECWKEKDLDWWSDCEKMMI